MTGTTPRGTATEQEASRWVRGMFGRIAGRYDFLNHLLSFNLDKQWRRRTARRLREQLVIPDARVLDVACGTADLLIELRGTCRHAAVIGSDFCHPMLVEARKKTPTSPLFESDALLLPLRDESLYLITIAFGFRNLANYREGLEEFHRVLKPRGVLAVLEFSKPPNRAWAAFYGFFSSRVLPRVAGWISGSREAYSYLPESIAKFPGADQLAEEMRSVGFAKVEYERMTGGAVALHLARK